MTISRLQAIECFHKRHFITTWTAWITNSFNCVVESIRDYV